MLKTYLILKYKKHGKEPLYVIPEEVLQRIILHLKNKGVECGKIKRGTFMVYCKCSPNVGIGVAEDIYFDYKEAAMISVACSNYTSFWQHIFKRPKDEEIYSGDALQKFVNLVDEAIRSDDYFIIHHDWMHRSEYLSIIRP
ncbi:MAG TPA: hypothetical protein PKB02_04605 [Anaerohalosphaeraceae bacterium]|nr:hypothetical protein [Anaerohalosphaeraceae bacterium]